MFSVPARFWSTIHTSIRRCMQSIPVILSREIQYMSCPVCLHGSGQTYIKSIRRCVRSIYVILSREIQVYVVCGVPTRFWSAPLLTGLLLWPLNACASCVRLARTICIYSVCTVFLAGKSPNIRSYTVHIYGHGQPYSRVKKEKGKLRWQWKHSPHGYVKRRPL